MKIAENITFKIFFLRLYEGLFFCMKKNKETNDKYCKLNRKNKTQKRNNDLISDNPLLI